jgi:cystathionine beta-lyase/cystathionine gamma-synthase
MGERPHSRKAWKVDTQVVQGGEKVTFNTPSKITPIYQTSVFTFEDLDHLDAYYDQPKSGFMYTRFANPNHTVLERHIAQLEGAENAVAAASGMGAILASLLTFAGSGDHVVCSTEIYGGTLNLIQKELARLGIACTFADFTRLDEVEAAIQPQTKVLISETITNPLLHVIDIASVADLAHRHGAKLVVDNTFSTPLLIKPLEAGADLVLHSATKYIGGHSDVTSGVVAGHRPSIDRAREIVVGFGASLSPFEAWLTLRGAKTLALRFRKQCENALKVASALAQHPAVTKVYYPGLEGHPQHELASRQFDKRYGAMLSFALADDREVTNAFMNGLEWVPFAPSLAGVETTISHPLRTSHRALTPEMQAKLGIHVGLIRVSIGIEDPDDIVHEFTQALDRSMGKR